MAYRALYRQWRPKTFSEMVGQQAIVETLRNQVMTDRVAHAYLFCGSRGTGKTSTAKILAKAINCEHPVNGDPCGECANCLREESDASLDVMEIDAASNNGVDEMRDLRETVKYPPQAGRYKVYIIDEVHMLSNSAFNALLKTLEEPPAHVVFILATTEPQKLPATILSRCQRFDFGRISSPEIAGRLREAVDAAGAQATDGALMRIARAAEGGMRDALSILDMCMGYGGEITEALVQKVLGASDRSFLFRFGQALAEEDAQTVFAMIDELMRAGRDPAVFSREFSGHLRALIMGLCCGDEMAKLMDLTEEDAAEYRKQAQAFTVTRLMRMLDLFLALETEMRYSSTPRLALENTSLKCCLRTAETDMRALTDRLEELEKKLENIRLHPAAAPMTETAAKWDAKPAEGAAPAVPVKKAEPKKTAVAAAAGPAEGIWDAFMKLVKKRDPALLGYLAQGSFAGRNGNEFLWQATVAGAPFVEPLNREERREKIAALLTEAAGEACTFRASAAGTQPAKAAGPDREEQRYVSELSDIFGREQVSIVE